MRLDLDLKLKLANLPFYFGVLDSPQVSTFPLSLPFSLRFDDARGLIKQESSPAVANWVREAYEFGSSLSTPLGHGTFGKAWAEDVVNAIASALSPKGIGGKSFLEVGCGRGYLLELLKSRGARRCVGIEPSPQPQHDAELCNVQIIREFFDPQQINEQFDMVFTHGVLEHIENVQSFLNGLKSCTKKGGTIFTAVPDCEPGLAIGDLSLPAHEHYSYFTSRSLRNLYRKAGFDSVQYRRANHGWMLYMWGTVPLADARPLDTHEGDISQERKLFENYVALSNNMIERVQGMIDELEDQEKRIGIYGAYPFFLMFQWKEHPRFFDADSAKHGKYLPGCDLPIEDPRSLSDNPVDSLWVGPINHDRAIREFLQNDLQISPDSIVSMKEIYASEARHSRQCSR